MCLKFNPINGEKINCETFFNSNNGIFLYVLEKRKLDDIDVLFLYGFYNLERVFDYKNKNRLLDINTV